MSDEISTADGEPEPVNGQKLKILFLCTGNTCRSQMAEGLARHLKSEHIEPYSAGVDPGALNSRAVKSMAKIGIDISGSTPKTIESLSHIIFDYVITLCDHANESCPLFPGKTKKLHRGFEDPPSWLKPRQPKRKPCSTIEMYAMRSGFLWKNSRIFSTIDLF
jgi:arsenate reductase (thioredoxin)